MKFTQNWPAIPVILTSPLFRPFLLRILNHFTHLKVAISRFWQKSCHLVLPDVYCQEVLNRQLTVGRSGKSSLAKGVSSTWALITITSNLMSHQVSNCCILLPLLTKLRPVVGNPDQCESESDQCESESAIWLKKYTSNHKIVRLGLFESYVSNTFIEVLSELSMFELSMFELGM